MVVTVFMAFSPRFFISPSLLVTTHRYSVVSSCVPSVVPATCPLPRPYPALRPLLYGCCTADTTVRQPLRPATPTGLSGWLAIPAAAPMLAGHSGCISSILTTPAVPVPGTLRPLSGHSNHFLRRLWRFSIVCIVRHILVRSRRLSVDRFLVVCWSSLFVGWTTAAGLVVVSISSSPFVALNLYWFTCPLSFCIFVWLALFFFRLLSSSCICC